MGCENTDHEILPRPPRGHHQFSASAVKHEALAADEHAVDRPHRVRVPRVPKLQKCHNLKDQCDRGTWIDRKVGLTIIIFKSTKHPHLPDL